MSFRLRAVLSQRPLAIDLVSALLAHVKEADRAFRDEMITAFSEAFNNVVTHGYEGRSDGMVEIEAELSEDQMILRLIDGGLAVDFASVSAPDLDSLPEKGMGIFLMRSIVDDVDYVAGDLNVLTLTKRVR